MNIQNRYSSYEKWVDLSKARLTLLNFSFYINLTLLETIYFKAVFNSMQRLIQSNGSFKAKMYVVINHHLLGLIVLTQFAVLPLKIETVHRVAVH